MRLGVVGMTCGSCVRAIEGNLRPISGVVTASVSLAEEKAVIVFDPAVVTVDAIKNAIEDSGFEATVEHVDQHISVGIQGKRACMGV